jgi:molybdopterin/thiamine biosynthesis adenylyltransferase/rhodanese-related sulfurtransferase
MQSRYSRQSILPEIGAEGQEKLRRAKVLCIGAGGLGCPALLYLAGAGIGTLGIVDHDRVDISNLQRQILFTAADQGRAKAIVAQERLLALNPEITVQAFDCALTDSNAESLISSYDVIIDATDNFTARFLINDIAVKLKKPVVFAAIQGFDGQVSVFNSGNGPCYRCLYPQPPTANIRNCAEAGIIGALAGIMGSVQTMEVIKLAVGHDSFKSLTGRLWMMDGRTMETRAMDIPKNKDCPACSEAPVKIVASGVVEITVEDAISMNNIIFFDVREEPEWNNGAIPQAKLLPLSLLKDNPHLFNAPGENFTALLYCQRGMRSRNAVEILQAAGFKNLYSLRGGYEAWCSRTQS